MGQQIHYPLNHESNDRGPQPPRQADQTGQDWVGILTQAIATCGVRPDAVTATAGTDISWWLTWSDAG